MRRALLAATAAAVLLLSGCNADDIKPPGQAEVDVDTPHLRALKKQTDVADCRTGDATDAGLPDLTLPCLGGGPSVDLSSLEGPVIVNLWASYCGPCRKEMPALQAFYEQYGDQVPVVGVDYQDQQPDAALELAKKSGVTYPLVADPGGDLNANAPVPVIRGIPFFLFVSADGEVTAAPGGVDSVDDLVDLVGKNLGISL
ncbi:TlpA family protein disulfide reductase [Nocardioides mangrovi]|uniref:TlpA family protein disulfide reductase n=1 Tax=Nocardioides mangrovi TaxID=2874580 RepID=A0ABS7UDK4_9ACTN|nr:TlpA disulfide reductase family protein [Nocardioides mangrovi]MBZ5739074.1 TlpA family protein disulfide reductase [Nocardioides mangrovi]